MIQALAQNGSIVLDGVFDDWAAIEGLEDSFTEDTPAVDLLEMKVTNDAEHLYIYVRLASDLDLTDVLYAHNLFLQDRRRHGCLNGVPSAGGLRV